MLSDEGWDVAEDGFGRGGAGVGVEDGRGPLKYVVDVGVQAAGGLEECILEEICLVD